MTATLKRSRQRDAIISYLATRRDHPTADMIYSALRETMPNISLGTVYRNLALLSERGDILKLSFDGKVDHYDGFTHPHCHFICKECNAILDLDVPVCASFLDEAKDGFEGEITSYSIFFNGTCEECLHKTCASM